jgi:hypothetical protein
MLLSVEGQKNQRASRSGMGAFSMSRRSLCVFVSSPTRPVSLRMRALSRSGVPLFDRPKRGRKKPHRERPGTDYRPRRLIEWSSTITRAPSPFSRGRRTGRGDGTGLIHLVLVLFYPSFSPLSRGETQGRASCFARKDVVPLSRNSRASSPLPGEGGTGWVDRQRYRRLVPFPFYPSFFLPSPGERLGGQRRALCRETLPRA